MLCSLVDQEISMTDTSIIDLDTGAVVEKRGRGHPHGHKNKPIEASMVISLRRQNSAKVALWEVRTSPNLIYL
jgi:hypothetical protein